MIGAIVLTVDSNYRVSSRRVQNTFFTTRRLAKRITF